MYYTNNCLVTNKNKHLHFCVTKSIIIRHKIKIIVHELHPKNNSINLNHPHVIPREKGYYFK